MEVVSDTELNIDEVSDPDILRAYQRFYISGFSEKAKVASQMKMHAVAEEFTDITKQEVRACIR